MGKFATVGGVTGVGFLALGLGLPKLIEGMSPIVSYGLVAFGSILAITAFVWSLLNNGGAGAGGTEHTTHGAHSPIIGSVARDFHYHPPAPTPVALQERKSPYGSGQKPGYARLAAMYACPETPVASALAHLMSLGHTKEGARLKLQQAFAEGSMPVWGRMELPPTTYSSPELAQETWERILPAYWKEFRLNAAAFDTTDEAPQTEPQPHVRTRLRRRYWSLRVSDNQVREKWRSQPADDDDGSWKTV